MKTSRELVSFGVTGAIGFVVDVSVLYLLAPVFGWYAARVLSFLAAATATWALNRRYTFAPKEGVSIAREYLSYLVTMLGGAAVNYAAYVLVLHWLSGPYAPALGVAAGSIARLGVNFLAARHLIFKRRGH